MAEASDGVVLVFVNVPPAEASGLAGALVVEKLAACVNVLPQVQSLYLWEGKLCDEGESTLLIKTTRARLAALTERVKQLHSYEVPEVLALSALEAGNLDYLAWVRTQMSQEGG